MRMAKLGLACSLVLGTAASSADGASGTPAHPRSAAAPIGGQSSYYENGLYGFKLKPPRSWTQVPVKVEEQWLVAKYLSDKEYRWIDPVTKWDFEHRPELLVVAFVKRDESGDDQEVEDEGGDGDVSIDEAADQIVLKGNPYRDYEDFLDKTYHGGGHHVDEREELEVGDVAVTRLAIKVSKLSYSGPKHIETWIYHLDGVDVAVQIEVLEDSWKKLKSAVKSVHRSFREVPRTEGPLTQQTRTLGWISFSMMNKGTPDERREIRVKAEQQMREKIESTLTDGWSAEPIERCFVVTKVDDKFSKECADQVTAVFEWLEDNLPFVGPDEYVREAVVRICESDEEASSFRRGSGDWSLGWNEIVTYKEKQWFDDWKWEVVNEAAYRHWFREKDFELWFALPPWIDTGLREFVANSKEKNGKLEFRVDHWDKDLMREYLRDGRGATPRELMGLTNEDFRGADYSSRHYFSEALVRFLLAGKGSKSSSTKHLIKDYLANLDDVLREIAEEEKASGGAVDDTEPQTEEEEDARFRARRERYKEKERRILDETFDRTFAGWSSKDWETFNADFEKAID